ncbi:hypothetical protein BJ138DRAFT_1072869 [Hygrophoropsis aurantiaca]|uniref:Uncharacterized protein n=1 Tax=Hygrophoropsis aurantiaca TaxID=72124 RepID=A0ACB7ZVW7_9AGAM|nr:hypothetical protein BJ138DRAFT_1072869 [Hygrophoropsis aurantiaca]
MDLLTTEFSRIDLQFTPQLPTELWLMCLAYLPRRDIQQLISVSRQFHQICIEPLFEKLVTSSPSPADLANTPEPSHLLRSENASRCLKSLSSDPDAYHTRQAVRNWSFRGLQKRRPIRYSTHVSNAYTALADTFTSSLPAFPHLSVLQLSFMEVNNKLVGALECLPRLHTLALDNCEIRCTKSAPLPIATLSITQTFRASEPKPNTPSSPDRSHSTSSPITHILSPTHLERLTLDDNRLAPSAVSSFLFLPPFQRLTHLAILVPQTQGDAFFEFLGQCPQLRSLAFARHSSIAVPDRLPPEVVPHLEAYEGPLALAKVFAVDRHLKHARIHLAVTGYGGESVPVYEVLSGLAEFFGVAHNLQSLTICGAPPGLQVLRSITAYLPDLQMLDISLMYSDPAHGGSGGGGTQQTPLFFSAAERDEALRISALTGVEVDRSTGFPKDMPNTAHGIMSWLIVGKVSLPRNLREFSVRSPPRPSGTSEKMDVRKMLVRVSGLYSFLRRLCVGDRVWMWVGGGGSHGNVGHWDEYEGGLGQADGLVGSYYL